VINSGERWWVQQTRTRRGARKLFLQFCDLPERVRDQVDADDDLEVVVTRFERGRFVADWRLPASGPPDAGVREPRWPRPFAGGGAAVVDPFA